VASAASTAGHSGFRTAPQAGTVMRVVRAKKIAPEYRAELEGCFLSMSGSVYGFLRRLTRGDKELSEDVLQETFRKAAVSWHELRDLTDDARQAWLIKVAFNTATEVFRHQEIGRKKWPQICERYSPAETDVHRQAITAIAVQRFIEVIEAMPPARSQVAYLFWRCGWENHEIAKTLGISAGRVTQQLAAARQTLEKELSPYIPYDFPPRREGNDHDKED
jgi:RNA polymerase sigma-70 factor (ECF subfamily)